jgi:hypothetical protein
MKRTLGLAAAALLVLLQLAGFAACHVQPAMDLTPIEHPELVSAHRA